MPSNRTPTRTGEAPYLFHTHHPRGFRSFRQPRVRHLRHLSFLPPLPSHLFAMTPPRELLDFTQAAPYGQACDNCSRAKVKCMRRPLGQPEGPCERCHRRGRESECVSPSRPRHRQRRKPGTSRTAHLEAKLDSLVSLLQSSHQSTHPLPTAISPIVTPSATTGTPSLSGDGDGNRDETTRSSNDANLVRTRAALFQFANKEGKYRLCIVGSPVPGSTHSTPLSPKSSTSPASPAGRMAR